MTSNRFAKDDQIAQQIEHIELRQVPEELAANQPWAVYVYLHQEKKEGDVSRHTNADGTDNTNDMFDGLPGNKKHEFDQELEGWLKKLGLQIHTVRLPEDSSPKQHWLSYRLGPPPKTTAQSQTAAANETLKKLGGDENWRGRVREAPAPIPVSDELVEETKRLIEEINAKLKPGNRGGAKSQFGRGGQGREGQGR